MSLTGQGLTADERSNYARMEDKSVHQVNELRMQILKTHIDANPDLVRAIATDIRTKILNNPQLKRDAGL
jgi:hypothetical protein